MKKPTIPATHIRGAYSYKEAATYLGISLRMLHNLVSKFGLPQPTYVRGSMKRTLFLKSDLDSELRRWRRHTQQRNSHNGKAAAWEEARKEQGRRERSTENLSTPESMDAAIRQYYGGGAA